MASVASMTSTSISFSRSSRLQVLRSEVGKLFSFGDEHRPLRAGDEHLILLACLGHDGVEALDVLGQRHLATAASTHNDDGQADTGPSATYNILQCDRRRLILTSSSNPS